MRSVKEEPAVKPALVTTSTTSSLPLRCNATLLEAEPPGRMARDVVSRFRNLRTLSQGGGRKPNKPLLALWAIGQCLRGTPRLLPYCLVERSLRELMERFGRPTKTINTVAPFWRMQRDRVWEIDRPALVGTTGSGDAFVTDLRHHDICGGLTESDYAAFRADPGLALQVAQELVDAHFPDTLRIEILEATSILEGVAGFDDVAKAEQWLYLRRRRRDARFRENVLAAYGHQCAVCGFAGHFRDEPRPLALEAAHIKWHQYKGPDVVKNGLSLCALHHELFDKGAFTILPEGLSVIVTDAIEGAGVEAALGRYDRRPLEKPPLEAFSSPEPKFLAWHRREVFKASRGAAP